MPRVMRKKMLATTANNTSDHFGIRHLLHKNNKIFTLDRIKECEVLENSEGIREYAYSLRVKKHSGVKKKQETTCYRLICLADLPNEKSDAVVESNSSLNIKFQRIHEEGRKMGQEVCKRNHFPNQHYHQPILITSSS
jgi:hypothetical protein